MALPMKRKGGKKTNRLISCGIFTLVLMLVLGINMKEYKSIQKIKESKEADELSKSSIREFNPSANKNNMVVLSDETASNYNNNNYGDKEEEEASKDSNREESEDDKEVNWVEEEHRGESSDDQDDNPNASDNDEKDKSEDKEEKENSSPSSSSSRPPWWDSSKSTVIAMAAGYGLSVYHQLVGSLRATGFQGNIILGVAPNLPPDIVQYFERMRVTWKEVPMAQNCTYHGYPTDNGQESKLKNCPAAYPDYKMSWGRFPLARDWLLDCEECTGGVMLTDARDAYFQSDPFAYPFGDKPMEELPGELMVFQEIPTQTTSHWLVFPPVKSCRKEELRNMPMLCSGSTMGTRQGILDYIDVMVKEFDYWKEHQECRSDGVGDDQSIHNYLYYTNQIKNAASIPHRTGPIHIVGVQANLIFRATIKKAAEDGYGEDLQKAESFVNNNGYMHWGNLQPGQRYEKWRTWLSDEHELINPETGLITNLDGKPSPQVHQFDRFGLYTNSQFIMDLLDVNEKTKEWS